MDQTRKGKYFDTNLFATVSPELTRSDIPESYETRQNLKNPEEAKERGQLAAALESIEVRTDTFRQPSEDSNTNYKKKFLSQDNIPYHALQTSGWSVHNDREKSLTNELEAIGPRPSTPPRRRPRIKSMGSISVGCRQNTLGSGSPAMECALADRQYDASPPSDRLEPDVVEKRNSAPQIPPDQDSRLDARRRENHAKALSALTGRKETTALPSNTLNRCMAKNTSRDRFCAIERPGSGPHSIQPSDRTQELSGAGRIHARKNFRAGYLNGTFVTIIESDAPPTEEPKKDRKVKRYFCM